MNAFAVSGAFEALQKRAGCDCTGDDAVAVAALVPPSDR